MNKYDEVYEKIKKQYYNELDNNNTLKGTDPIIIKYLILLLLVPLLVLIARLIASEKTYNEFLLVGIIVFLLVFFTLFIYVFLRSDTSGKESTEYLNFRSRYVDSVGTFLLNYYFENVQRSVFDALSPYKNAGFYLKKTNDYVIHDQWLLVNDNEFVKLTNLSLGKIEKDEDGKDIYHNVFNGTFVDVDLDICFDFKTCVCLNYELYSRMDYLEKIEMDYSLFENIFNVYTDNKISTMQLINSEFLTDLYELYKNTPCRFDLVIDGNKLYIRLYIKENMFNVSKKDSISKSNVINDMKYLETIKEIIRLVHYYYDTNLHEFR